MLAGTRPGGRPPFLLVQERRQRTRPQVCDPNACATGQTCVGALAGCAAELTARYALRSDNCGKSVYASMRASTRMLTPQAPRPRRSPRGLNSPTRAIAALGPATGAPLTRPSAAMARVVPPPFWPCREAQGAGRACAEGHTPSLTDLPQLFECNWGQIRIKF